MRELKRKVTQSVNSVEVYDYCFGACTCVDACSFKCKNTNPTDKQRDNYDTFYNTMDHDSHVA